MPFRGGRLSVFIRLLQYALPYRARIAVGILCTVATIGIEAIQPLVMREIIDEVLTEYVSGGKYIGHTFAPERVDQDIQLLLTFALFFPTHFVKSLLKYKSDPPYEKIREYHG